jgi:Na(+)-translocating NADH:ubiquinone oxidoreductase F subunit
LEDGSPARAPICRGLATYPVEERDGRLWLNVMQAGGDGARPQKTYSLRVVSNKNVATFIKELVLEPVSEKVDFTPGDYLQFDIPSYENIHFSDFNIPAPYNDVWRQNNLFDLNVGHQEVGRRNNYSLASNSATEKQLKFNVRISMPPKDQAVPPGVGSSYVFNLRPGDELTAIGPFGDFHIKPTQKEMVYIGGGAGMAPIRAHIAHLFETEKTQRKVSYWYGARSRQEIFYDDYFQALENENHNFDFHIALSEALEEDEWTGATGFIHEVVFQNYLKDHPHPQAVEFYLCGPPAMVEACMKMLTRLGVTEDQVSYDEF